MSAKFSATKSITTQSHSRAVAQMLVGRVKITGGGYQPEVTFISEVSGGRVRAVKREGGHLNPTMRVGGASQLGDSNYDVTAPNGAWYSLILDLSDARGPLGSDYVKAWVNGAASTFLNSSPTNWATALGAVETAAGAMRIGGVAGADWEGLELAYVPASDVDATKAAAFHAGVSPRQLWPGAEWFLRGLAGLSAGSDLGTLTEVGVTYDGAGDPALLTPSAWSVTVAAGATVNIASLSRNVAAGAAYTYTAVSGATGTATVAGSLAMASAATATTGGPIVVTGVAAGSTYIDITEVETGLKQRVLVTVTAGGGGDATPPSVPTGLTPAAATSTSVSWTLGTSTDGVGVTAYQVREDGGAPIDVGLAGTHFRTGLTHPATVTLEQRARDAAANWSGWSTGVPNSTAAPGTKRWRVPTNAPVGTFARVVILAADETPGTGTQWFSAVATLESGQTVFTALASDQGLTVGELRLAIAYSAAATELSQTVAHGVGRAELLAS